MLHIISALKNIFTNKQQCEIDLWIFRIHYRATVYILLVFCFLVCTKQYAGEPIRCSKSTQDYSSIVEIYCYITTTYTVNFALNMTPSDGAPHPGIYPTEDENDFRYHKYYQWVGFVLLIQAIAFYLPHWVWSAFENGRISWLVFDNDRVCPVENRQHKKTIIVEYIHTRWSTDRTFAVKYFCCEIACLINLILQMEALDNLFDKQFYYYGIEAVYFLKHGSSLCGDPFIRMFPRVTSCTYRYLGETGMVRNTSVICLLAVNVINEKIFLFLWFWFVILAVLTFFTVVFRLVVFSFTPLRLIVLRSNFKTVPETHLKVLIENGNLSDFLFMILLGQNMNDFYLKDVIADLKDKLLERNILK